MSLPNWNIDSSSNKFTDTYVKGYVDISGGDIISRSGNLYLAPNSSIYTSANQIQFNEDFHFTDFIDNVNVMGQLKNTYNSVEYDLGYQSEKVDQLVDDVATLSPIVSDTQFKCTNFYYDQALNSTIFSNNVSFGNSSISSIAINNSSFVALSGAQSIDGVKTFNSAPVMSGASITNLSIPVGKITGTAVALSGTQTITATKTFSVAQTFQNNIRLDGGLVVNNGTTTITNTQLQQIPNYSASSVKTTAMTYTALTNATLFSGLLQFSGSINGWSDANFFNAINNTNTLTSPAQTQINNINAVSLSSANTFTGNQTFNGATTTISNTLATSNITFSGNLNTIPSATFAFINSLTSNAQAQLTNLATKLTAISYEGSNTTTTIAGDLIFLNNLNSISATTFGYLSGVTSAIQTQLNSLSTRIATFELVGTIIMSPLSDIHTTSGNKYLHCTGQTVSRSTYSALFAKIGTNFGAGDGSTTFSVPNYQGLFFRGMGGQVINGTTYTGIAVNNAQQDAVQDHQHSPQSGAYLGTSTSASNSGGYLNSPLQRPNQYNFDNTGAMVSGRISSTETRPVNVGIYYYIKT